MNFAAEPYPHYEVAARIAVSLGVGLLIGLEREWAQKEVGVRTFAITALLGALTSLLDQPIVVTALIGVLLLVTFLNVQSMRRDGSLELTTSAALIITLVVGALAGRGHFFTSISSAIAVTMLLAWKLELARFADGLQPEEIRSAVLLGLLSLVIYPLLPDRFIDPWELVNPRGAWVMVVVIAGLGFGNYWLLRIYGMRGAFYAAFLGGLVNSTAAGAELAGQFKRSPDGARLGLSLLLVTNVAMFVRNIAILALFAPAVTPYAAPPLALLAAVMLAWAWFGGARAPAAPPELRMTSPVSLSRVLGFGVLFLVLTVAGTLAQRYLGGVGFLVLSVVGGMVSSASTTASAAALAAGGKITVDAAARAVVLASVASTVASLPVVYSQTGRGRLFSGLAWSTIVIVVLGLGMMAVPLP